VTFRSGGALRAVPAGLVAAAVLMLAGCSSDVPASSGSVSSASTGTGAAANTPTTAITPVAPQGFRAVTVVITLPDGHTREWCMWLADTPARREQGLMGVTDPGLGGAPGMVFAFPGDTSAGFWMKDTLMPLSIAWYPADGPLVSTADMDPCPAGTASCPVFSAADRYRYAVETPQGVLDALGLVEGSSLALGAACTPGDGSA
jgi:uncharacterized protein